MQIQSKSGESFKQMLAYKRLKKVCVYIAQKLDYDDYADEFYQKSKGYYNLINMSEDDMINHFSDDFKSFVKNYNL
jgi:hypothetical protein